MSSHKFLFDKIRPDGWQEKIDDNGIIHRIPLYSRSTQCREHGRDIFKVIIQADSSGLDEGPAVGDIRPDDS